MRYEDVEWHAAACKGIDTELFFIEQASEAAAFQRRLRPICLNCPIYDDCLEYALENEFEGFWAGMTARQRKEWRGRRLRSRRAA